MTYYVTAIRYQRESDGSLMVADKRVHTGLSHSEARALMQRYSPKLTGYWAQVHMGLEEKESAI